MIQLLSGPHLVVVTSRKSAGSILGKDIWLVTSTKTMPCATVAHQKLRLNSDQVEDELRYVDLLEHFLATTGIYYSAAYNLTRSLQAQASRFSSVDGPAFGPEDIDFGYFLNKHLAEPFLRDPKGSAFPFLSVCIEGCKPMLDDYCAYLPS